MYELTAIQIEEDARDAADEAAWLEQEAELNQYGGLAWQSWLDAP